MKSHGVLSRRWDGFLMKKWKKSKKEKNRLCLDRTQVRKAKLSFLNHWTSLISAKLSWS
jgi:hypothetical protein